jgi:hypothetical protein
MMAAALEDVMTRRLTGACFAAAERTHFVVLTALPMMSAGSLSKETSLA